MNKKMLNNMFQWGILTALVAVALPDLSFASSIGTSLNTFRTTDLKTVPTLVSGIAYAGGTVLGISGALKLKKHAENPQQNPIAPGIAHLLAGGGIAALPTLLSTSKDTLHMNGSLQYESMPSIN